MRKLIIVLLLAVSSEVCRAQRIHFIDSSNRWSLIYFTDDPASVTAASWYGSETILAGKVYRQLHTSSIGPANVLAIREYTLQQKLFFRFLSISYRHLSALDTF